MACLAERSAREVKLDSAAVFNKNLSGFLQQQPLGLLKDTFSLKCIDAAPRRGRRYAEPLAVASLSTVQNQLWLTNWP